MADRASGDGADDGDDVGFEDRPGESRNARRRRRRRNKGGGESGGGGQSDNRFEQRERRAAAGRRPRAESGEPAVSTEPVRVAGYLDLRDEGYGFLRVNGYLSSRDDAYIPVKLTRQYGLRKGDYVTGLSRPAGRNEKNPALLEIHTVNGGDPDKAKSRPRFEDLTALFPDEKLKPGEPERPEQHDGADHRPRLADRQGPARHHRLAAQGRQDDDHEDDRHVDRGATTPRSS